MSEMFSNEEYARYSRHFILPEFGLVGQEKLKKSKVLLVGLGGLGAPLSLYLAAAGVGQIGLLDDDVVDESNLQRQVLYTVDDVGKYKCQAAYDRLSKLNPHIEFKIYQERLTSQNALEIIKAYDVVADGTDNFQTRYLVNDACVLLGKCNVYGSIFRFEGQVSVFNYYDGTSFGPNYRDLFPEPPPAGMVPSCAEGGVLGVLPGIVGSMQANEVIKVITGIGEPLSGRLFVFDAAYFETRTLKFKKKASNPISGDQPTIRQLIDYDEFCGIGELEEGFRPNEITVKELQSWRKDHKEHQLIDVREAYEYEIGNLGGVLIPKGDIEKQISEISTDLPVVVHCRSGKRSAEVIDKLQTKYGFSNLLNLRGGILAWSKEVDPSLPAY